MKCEDRKQAGDSKEETEYGREDVSPKLAGKRLKLLFFLYMAWVIKVIIFKYPMESLRDIAANWEQVMIREGLEHANFTFLKTIRMYIRYAYKLNSLENLAGNVVVFIPLGILLPFLQEDCRKFSHLLLNVLIFVVGIEIFQLFSAFGVFDVDDILLNTIGAVLGWILYHCWKYGR